MKNVRLTKLYRDLLTQKSRTLMVLIAMIIGIFSFTMVANAYVILNRELVKNYENTTPSTATIVTQTINENQLDSIREMAGVKAVETRQVVMGRIQTNSNQYKSIMLFVIPDYDNLTLDTFKSEEGAYPPKTGDILIERVAVKLSNATLNNPVVIDVPGGNTTRLDFTGTVHAPGLAPAWMEGTSYGFINQETYRLFNAPEPNTEIRLLLSDAPSKEIIKEQVEVIREALENQGITVIRIHIPEPNQHPHQRQMKLLLYLMEIFGAVAIVLSSILIANVVSAILEQQMRQIGIMKATGATTLDITTHYLSMILLLAIIATVVGLPLGLFVGRAYATFASGMLNFDIFDNSIPHLVLMLEIATSLLIPIIITLKPIYDNTRHSVKETLQENGIDTTESRNAIHLNWLSKPIALSVKNAFRKKARLFYTLLVITIGGTGFITALNVYASMNNTVETRMDATNFNLQIKTVNPIESRVVTDLLKDIPEINDIESWNGGLTQIVHEDGTLSNSFSLMAPPIDTKGIDAPDLYEGRWLTDPTQQEIVINQRIQIEHPDIRTGSYVTLRLNGKDTRWLVTGVLEELIGEPYAYVNQAPYQALTGLGDTITTVNIFSDETSVDFVSEVVEERFREAGIQIRSSIKLSEFRHAIEDHLLLIAILLIIMSVLVLIVSGIGMAITMGINVLERTKEIGVLKAIGGSKKWIYAMVLTEGSIIGLLSFFLAILLSYPLSQFISYNFGLIFFEAPLRFVTSPMSYIIWLSVIVVFTVTACLLPAQKAANLSVTESLSYE